MIFLESLTVFASKWLWTEHIPIETPEDVGIGGLVKIFSILSVLCGDY